MISIWKVIRHNQSLAIGIVIALAVALWAYGCQSSVVSIVNPPTKLTRPGLVAEVEAFEVQARLRFAALDMQDKLKSTLFNTAIEFAAGGKINPIAFAVTIGNLIGLSAIIDNRRKDVRIKSLKKELNNGKEAEEIPDKVEA